MMAAAAFTALIFSVSCSKDDSGDQTPSTPENTDIAGNYSGTLSVSVSGSDSGTPTTQAQNITVSWSENSTEAIDLSVADFAFGNIELGSIDLNSIPVTVDGDTSTNDMFVVMASGKAENAEISDRTAEFEKFCQLLSAVSVTLCKKIAADGEGATKLLECRVSGAATKELARKAAKSVVGSALVKAAMFGSDANWGRVLCALGYSDTALDAGKADVAFSSAAGRIEVCLGGSGIDFSEEKAKAVLSEKEITIEVDLGCGVFDAVAWGCDLTYDYVKINGDYRT